MKSCVGLLLSIIGSVAFSSMLIFSLNVAETTQDVIFSFILFGSFALISILSAILIIGEKRT